MAPFVVQDQQIVADLAAAHDFSEAAVHHMLAAVAAGNGAMAEFDHPEFGGPGMWMRGGMLMLSDPNNHALKARVDGLCEAVAHALASNTGLFDTRTTPDPSYRSSQSRSQDTGSSSGGSDSRLFGANSRWWPETLGTPNTVGQQNDTRYAWFADAERLAIHDGNEMRLYDTGDHRITGVSQQQHNDRGGVTFTSQHGPVDIDRLTKIDNPAAQSRAAGTTAANSSSNPDAAEAAAGGTDVFVAIERLGELKARGLLSEEEFAAKKVELLARL